jgi:hypothetical protein
MRIWLYNFFELISMHHAIWYTKPLKINVCMVPPPTLQGCNFSEGINLFPARYIDFLQSKLLQDLQSALRRAGQNPTESEVQDMINKIYDGSASLTFPDFCLLIGEKAKELDPETHFKDTFRVFSKDEEGDDNSETFNEAK